MADSRYRVLVLASHPVQYQAPIFRLMAEHAALDLTVAYCSLKGVERSLDREFGVEVAWDVPLLDGYRYIHLGKPGGSRGRPARVPLRLQLEVWRLVRRGKFDAIVMLTGYLCAAFWSTLMAARTIGTPVLFGTDATTLRPRDGKAWKALAKRLLLPHVFDLARIVTVPSTGSVRFVEALGIPSPRIVMVPFAVDNAWWNAQAKRVDREAARATWGIPADASLMLFCGKLQPWKRPGDVLHAFAMASVEGSHLMIVGEGPLRRRLEDDAEHLGLAGRVHFLGFLNQSGLPQAYCASDILVLPSEYEPFGLVVNEAMLCSRPVIVSDRVGARHDLVRHGETGFIYRCGDVEALAATLRSALTAPASVRALGEAARRRMDEWSPQDNVAAFVRAISLAVNRGR